MFRRAVIVMALVLMFIPTSVWAQTYRTTPNILGGSTTTGPFGTYRTTPNILGGSTTTGPSGTYRTTPNILGGYTTTGPNW
jgi:hypothetical protein